MFKKIIIATMSLIVLLIIVLAVHIYSVTRPKVGGVPSLAMSRIDFPGNLDSLEGVAIKDKIIQMPGLKDVRVNHKSGHLICLYDRGQQAPQEIISVINDSFETRAELYQPSDELLAQSCPAIDKNSLTYKLGAFFQKTFEN